MPPSASSTRTVVVLGISYGGARAAKLLAETLPQGWRVVAIDRTSHMNHVYVFPRYIVKPDFAPKAFIPYTHLFDLPEKKKEDNSLPTPPRTPTADHVFIQGEVTSLEPHAVTLKLPENGDYDASTKTQRVEFDYCIYALGAGLPAPCDVWGEPEGVQGRGSKRGGTQWMAEHGRTIEEAGRILVVGAGALGIQFATDIKDLYPTKEVTLLHSRTRMMPRYQQEMHDAVVEGLERLGVKLVLGERVVAWPEDALKIGEKTVRTDKGSVFTADLVLACTGQTPHASLMASIDELTINPATKRISVRPTMQVSRCHDSEGEVAGGMARMNLETPALERSDPLSECTKDKNADLDHLFVVGDCADTTAIQAGHVAYYQAQVAAANIVKLIAREEGKEGEEDEEQEGEAKSAEDAGALELYTPSAPIIKVTLGFKHYVIAGPDGVTKGEDGVDDLQARVMWTVFHADDMGDDE